MTAVPPRSDNDRATREASDWLARLRAPKSENEADAFERWYVAEPANADAYDRVLQSWQQMHLVGSTPAGEARTRFFNVGPRPFSRRLAVGFVALMLFVIVGFGAVHFGAGQPLIPAAYASGLGQIRTIRLSDGSVVTLDTDSAVKVSFDKSDRRLTLVRGRARFVVANVSGTPFSVAAGDCVIIATGTIFDIDMASSTPSVSLTGARLIEALATNAGVDLMRSEAARLPRPIARSFEQRTNALLRETAREISATTVVGGGGGDNVFCSLQSPAPVADCLLDPVGRPFFWPTCRSVADMTQASVATVAWRAWRRARRPRAFRREPDVSFLSRLAIDVTDGALAHPWLAAPPGTLPGKAAHVALLIGAQGFVEDADPFAPLATRAVLMAQPLVETCLRIPSWQWFDRGRNRAAARRAFDRDLPSEIAWRRTKGSPDSLLIDLYETNKPLIRSLLLDGLLDQFGLLDRHAIATTIDDPRPMKDHTFARSRMCRLLSVGKARAGKGACHLGWADVEEWQEGLIALLLPDRADAIAETALARARRVFGDRAYMALSVRRRPRDAIRLGDLSAIAASARVPTVATNDVLYHSPDRRLLQDVVSCIREKCTIDELGDRRERFADRYLKTAAEMDRLFRRYLKDASPVARSVELAARCTFGLDQLKYQYPDEIRVAGRTPQQELERLTWEKAPERYPAGIEGKVRDQLAHELRLIAQLDYAPYFLTVHSIVAEARRREILCQGRGSAANSAVCYVLGITSIDPVRSELLFERFVSAERREPPDIDVDFEHERREEVIQWIYETYGRDRSALTAVVTRYRSRGAVREVGKALGLSEDMTAGLAGAVWGYSRDGVEDRHAEELNMDLSDKRLALTLELSRQLLNTPRHLSQHPGGFVLTRDRLDDLVPIEPAAMDDRQVIEWDKDDIDALGFMKVDVLALGMLSCMRRAFEFVERDKGQKFDLATIPAEDPATYAMIRKADTLGVFQIESRAQMASIPLMAPTTFYDLVIQVAIVRPGPIQGDMVHPYRRRRAGLEEVTYPTEELRRVLEKTLGVPLFQEQAMRVAIECAGFTASEADLLRRAMATFKLTGGVSHFRDKLIGGMVARGYDEEFATRTFKQIEGFGSYGFPESHAASFALIAYASSWMKCHHPDAFCAALLNAQPMGFYEPAQIVRDARQHGVEVRRVDVNASRWDCTLEPGDGRHKAVRLGLRMVRDLSNADGAAIALARGDQPFGSVEEIQRRAGVGRGALDRIGDADGFGSLGASRRAGLWDVKGLGDAALPLFAASDERDGKLRREAVEPDVELAPMGEGAEVVEDYRASGLSLRAHPLAFLRGELSARRVITCEALRTIKDGRYVELAGIVLVRQKPGSAKGVMFITIEDETDVANLVVWTKTFEANRRVVLGASMMGVRGQVQREGDVIHVIAHRLDDLSTMLASVGNRTDVADIYRVSRADVVKNPLTSDPRDPPARPLGKAPRDIFIPDLRLGSGIVPEQPTAGIKVTPRNFR